MQTIKNLLLNQKMHFLVTFLPKLIYATSSLANSPIHSCYVGIHITEKDRNITHTCTYLKGRNKKNLSVKPLGVVVYVKSKLQFITNIYKKRVIHLICYCYFAGGREVCCKGGIPDKLTVELSINST